jgi:hypothetical protein
MSLSSEQRKRLIARLIVLAIIIAVAVLKPRIQAWLNDGNQPGGNADLTATATGTEFPAELPDVRFRDPEEANSSGKPDEQAEVSDSSAVGESVKVESASIEPAPSKPVNSRKPIPGAQQTAEKQLGQLTEIRRRVFESTAGLIYLPGSADGHRLDHVMQHAEDDTSKRIHGVFEGDRDTILATIDEAFEKSRKGGRDVRTEDQNGRTVLTVRMPRKIGHMGGEEGQRQRNPECRYLRLVLENGNEVVSAYPTKSF